MTMVRYNDVTEIVTFTSILTHDSFFEDVSDVIIGSGNGSVRPTDVVGDVVGPALVGTVLTIVMLCTVVGNVMVLLAVFVNSHLRSTTNYFIVNLAIADLLLGTTVLPFSASLEVFKKWLFGQLFCDIWAAIDVLCCTASIFSLCVISIDRYIGVTRPLQRSSIMTERRAVYVILFIWLLAIAISVAPLIGWKEPPSADPYECTVTTQTGYVLFSVSASFYIPLSIILLVYFRIYREAIKHSRFLTTGVKTTKVDESGVTLRVHKGGRSHMHYGPHSPNCQPHNHQHHHHVQHGNYGKNTAAGHSSSASPGHQSSSSSDRSESSVVGNKNTSRLTAAGKVARFKRETKAAKTLGIVVGVFILCWFPFFFILPLGSLCSHCHIPPLLFNVFFWLGYCNSLMNPIIYACSSREFQFAFRRILRCKFRRRPRVFLNDQESSSCHEFNQLENTNVRRSGTGRSVKRTHSAKTSSKSRKDKFIRNFKSRKFLSSRQSKRCSSNAMTLHSLNITQSSSNDLHLSESPTQSVRDLQRKIGEELRTNNSLLSGEECDWSMAKEDMTSSLGQDTQNHEDLFEDLTVAAESVYPSCRGR